MDYHNLLQVEINVNNRPPILLLKVFSVGKKREILIGTDCDCWSSVSIIPFLPFIYFGNEEKVGEETLLCSLDQITLND